MGLDAAPLHATKPTITIVDGDGIGPELMDSVVGVLSAAEVPITWERFSTQGDVSEGPSDITERVVPYYFVYRTSWISMSSLSRCLPTVLD